MKYTLALICLLTLSSMKAQEKFNGNLAEYCSEAVEHFDEIPAERKAQLDDLALYVYETMQQDQRTSLTFICTHNSRRSHMAQLWAAAGAAYYGIENVHCFSGGTEATAFNPSAIDALERAGFKITKIQVGKNPVYEASWHSSGKSFRMYSKKYDDHANPAKDFAAVMVCSDADKNCPYVAGATTRLAIPYEDPKAFDGTPSESAMYDERCRQIAIEMLYTMRQVKERMIREN